MYFRSDLFKKNVNLKKKYFLTAKKKFKVKKGNDITV